MIHNLSFVKRLFGDPRTCLLENRIFNSTMLLVSLTSSIATVYNLVLGNQVIITACSAVSIVCTTMAYVYSKKTGNCRPLVFPVIVYFFVIMIVSWLANAGTMGAGSSFFFLLMSLGVLLLPKPFPVFMAAILITLTALLAVEYYFPDLLLGYANQEQRFFDVGISLILCLIFNGMIIHSVFREYLRERRLKDELLVEAITAREEVEKAHMEIRILQGCLPICASCKKIRDEKGLWNQVEDYLSHRTDVNFSHGICPDCVQRLYPELEVEKLH